MERIPAEELAAFGRAALSKAASRAAETNPWKLFSSRVLMMHVIFVIASDIIVFAHRSMAYAAVRNRNAPIWASDMPLAISIAFIFAALFSQARIACRMRRL